MIVIAGANRAMAIELDYFVVSQSRLRACP
jgi:hypothetical protein